MKRILIEESDFSYYVDKIIKQESLNKTQKFSKFLEMARNASIASNFETYKIGAAIKIKGRTIATGSNSYKTHPEQKKYNQKRSNFDKNAKHFKHAEFTALNKLKDVDLKKAEMFIYRTGSDGTARMSRPCAGCMDAIKERGIKVIHYTTSDGIATEYLSKDVLTLVKKSKRPI